MTEEEINQKNFDKMNHLVFLFNQENIPYLLVGGQAMRLRMSERMTGDIDILIDDDEGNRLKILNIIRNEVEQFDVHALNEEIKKRHKDEDYSALRFINNNDIVFDLMFRVGGMTYKELISYAEKVDLENQNYVKTINEKGLFLTKCFSPRDKDLSDCRSLRAMIEKRFGEFPDLENNKVVFKVKQKTKSLWKKFKKMF